MAPPFWFLLWQVDLTQSFGQSVGMCLGKMKTCLVPGVALCLLLVPLVGEWLLCPSSCPSGQWVQDRVLLGGAPADCSPLSLQGPSLCRMREVLHLPPVSFLLLVGAGEGGRRVGWALLLILRR